MDSTLNTSASPQAPGREVSSMDITQETLGHTLQETLKTQETGGKLSYLNSL